jgi:hypothetical protein
MDLSFSIRAAFCALCRNPVASTVDAAYSAPHRTTQYKSNSHHLTELQMTSTSMQVRLTSAVAAFAAASTMLLATAMLFNAPIATGEVVELSEVVVTPKATTAQVAQSVRAANTAQN